MHPKRLANAKASALSSPFKRGFIFCGSGTTYMILNPGMHRHANMEVRGVPVVQQSTVNERGFLSEQWLQNTIISRMTQRY